MSSMIETIREERLEKVAKLREQGIDPYPSKSSRTNKNREIVGEYDNFAGKQVTVVGRIVAWRDIGKLIFSHILDGSGKIQLFIRVENFPETNFKLYDTGDIVEATGVVIKTKTGEISVDVSDIRMLCKSIRPLPEKWEGLKDKETIYRQRYLDMIINPDKKYRFEKAAEILFAIRQFLHDKGYLEIYTPIMQPLYGGGNAKPFTTHVNALDTDFYLAISHELYLKRLITAGFEKIYNVAGYFRNEGIDRSHNPEFNMLETMCAYENYEYNMALIEEMYTFIGKSVFGKTVFKIGDHDVDFAKSWERISMLDAVKKYTGFDFNAIKTVEDGQKILDKIGYQETKPDSIGECMVTVFEEKVEKQLIEPTFITGHPVEISPLAKKMSSDPRFVERFEIYIGGIECGDNWTELNDPQELFARFKDQMQKRAKGDEEAHPMDIDFIEMMEYGMPPTTGIGPGIERLTMMFTETNYIDEVMFFPMMKPAPLTPGQRKIYGL